MDLMKLRAAIDDADRRLLRLLDDRLQLSVRAGRLKTVVGDPSREEEVIRKVRAGGEGLLDPEFLESLFRTIIEESRALQERHFRLAAFQGERGAWGELAIRTHDPSLVPMPCREFRDVFDAVAAGSMDVGFVPGRELHRGRGRRGQRPARRDRSRASSQRCACRSATACWCRRARTTAS